jgi:hypothetical protein
VGVAEAVHRRCRFLGEQLADGHLQARANALQGRDTGGVAVALHLAEETLAYIGTRGDLSERQAERSSARAQPCAK